MSIPIITAIGKSKSGKTTLLEKLIGELKKRGYRVATIKHHYHAGFDIDHPGKDSWRHAQAGSDHIVVASPDKIATYRRLEREMSLPEIAAGIVGVDIILAEGYKRAGMPAIEVVRQERGLELIGDRRNCIAVATDTPLETGIKQFDLDESTGITDLIVERYLSG
jgi:molybdopterin-guanine dinucleotide biosynthesis protein B